MRGAVELLRSAKTPALNGIVYRYGGVWTVGSYSGTADFDTRAFTGNVRLDGGARNDFIRSGSGHDIPFEGTGNDRSVSADGDDTLYGQDGNDVCEAGAGEDTLRGGGGLDTLFGDDDDWLYGDAGLDQLVGGDGNDRMDVSADGATNSSGARATATSCDSRSCPRICGGIFGQHTVVCYLKRVNWL